jgi:hemoglobin
LISSAATLAPDDANHWHHATFDGYCVESQASGYARLAMIDAPTLYERAGGTPFFEALVEGFYAGVADDEHLRAIYPEADLAGASRRLTLFLIQYWGGPRTYDAERGHPRLRMRHAPFAIGPVERDQWLIHMRASLAALAPPDDITKQLDVYFTMAAEAMRNRD